jgi:hypothetical protein
VATTTGAQHAQQLPAVQVGQAQVQHDEVGAVLDCLLQPGQRGAGRGHRVSAVPEGPDQGGTDPLVVLDHQQLRHEADASVRRHRGARICA